MHNFTVIRYRGRLYRIAKAPFEPEERAADRAWWIAKSGAVGITPEIVSQSHKWANEKYFGMKYRDAD